jgi:hypothetical protein
MPPQQDKELLPQNALKGVSVGLSVSESTDLSRLGLVENHFRLALAEIARTVLVSGGSIFYGGHLRPDGYTVFLLDELQKYGRRDRPLKVCLSWTEHQHMSRRDIEFQQENVGLFGELVFLSPEGKPITFTEAQSAEPQAFTSEEKAQALSGLRQYLAINTNARVVLGGKREGFQGAMPGLVEETIFSVQARKPLYLAGGFRGVTLDILQIINSDLVSWFPEREQEEDTRLLDGLSKLKATIDETKWSLNSNGLADDENALLAATYRPSEIAALVGLGLGRRKVGS